MNISVAFYPRLIQDLYSETSLNRTRLGTRLSVRFKEVSGLWRSKTKKILCVLPNEVFESVRFKEMSGL